MKNYDILPITEQYIDSLHAAIDHVAKERKYLAFLEGPSLEICRTFVLASLRANWPNFIAVSAGNLVGWCNITPFNNHLFAHAGALGIAVLAPHRGQGIGHALMHATLNKAKLTGLTRIELIVRENNTRAITLYQKFGFQTEGVHRNAIRIGTEYENHTSMALLFESPG